MNNEKPRTFEPIKSKQVWTVLLFCLFGVFLSYHPIRCDFHYPPPSAVQPVRQAEAVPAPLTKRQQVIRVAVNPTDWSEEVAVPAGSNLNFRYPDCWFQLLYTDGTTSEVRKDDGSIQNPIRLRSCKFRIRGDKGTIEVIIDPVAVSNAGHQEVRNFPKSLEDPLFMSSSQKSAVVYLESGVWSRQVVVPDGGVDYKTIVSPILDHFYIWFMDDTIMKISRSDHELKNYGMRKGVFRILVEEPGKKLTVTMK